jgi:hypothetical protein
MKQLSKVLAKTNWAIASNTINKNNDAIYDAVTFLESLAFSHKGYFKSLSALIEHYPTPQKGWQAFVYNADNAPQGLAQYDLYSSEINTSTSVYEWQFTLRGAGDIDVDIVDIEDNIKNLQDVVAQINPVSISASEQEEMEENGEWEMFLASNPMVYVYEEE